MLQGVASSISLTGTLVAKDHATTYIVYALQCSAVCTVTTVLGTTVQVRFDAYCVTQIGAKTVHTAMKTWCNLKMTKHKQHR